MRSGFGVWGYERANDRHAVVLEAARQEPNSLDVRISIGAGESSRRPLPHRVAIEVLDRRATERQLAEHSRGNRGLPRAG
jgi:hypothetical protein